MDATQLIPETGAIPIPWGWFEALSILTLVLHLLMMNALVGGGIVALAGHLRSKGGIGFDLRKKLPVIMAFVVNLGIAPLLFVQVLYGGFIYTGQILMGYYVLAIIALVIFGYYCLYIYRYKYNTEDSPVTWPLWLALVAVLTTGFIFVNIMTMMLNPAHWTAYFEQANGSVLATGDPTFWPKFLHMVNGALAIGGLFVALVWRMKPEEKEGRRDFIDMGLSWFKYPTYFQFVIGVWFFFSLPRSVRTIFLGQNIWATLAISLALISAGFALHNAYKKRVYTTTGFAVGTVVLMVITRAFMRNAYLGRVNYSAGDLPVTGELSPFILFAVTLVIGLAITFYMITLFIKDRKEA